MDIHKVTFTATGWAAKFVLQLTLVGVLLSCDAPEVCPASFSIFTAV
jgi:hypothetical protein